MRPFNVSTPRKRKDGKTFWLSIGAAWPRDDGGFKVDLDALPVADAEGKVTLLISPPREQGEYQPSREEVAREVGKMRRELDEDLPF